MQGLGLGKGLVKLSYDLAKRRGYADVTVSALSVALLSYTAWQVRHFSTSTH